MNILFDLSGCNQPYNAITVYGLRILAGFKENGYKDISILCDARIYDHVHVTFPEYPCLEIAFDTGRNPMTLLRNFRHWKNTVKNIEHDVLFVPHVFPPNFCFHRRDKTVLVLHDLQGLRIYKGLRLWACRFFYPLALWRCKASIVISDFVREDVRKTYPFISPRKLNTIYNGVVVDQLPQKRDTLPVKGKYLLYVSSLMEHKNVMTLLRAFNRLKDKIPHTLVIIGKTRPVWTEKALPFIQEENLSSRIYHVTKPVSDETLAQYYNQADLFIHPSLMEAFERLIPQKRNGDLIGAIGNRRLDTSPIPRREITFLGRRICRCELHDSARHAFARRSIDHGRRYAARLSINPHHGKQCHKE